MPESKKRDARGRMLDALRRELLGPSRPDEVIRCRKTGMRLGSSSGASVSDGASLGAR